MPEKDRPVIISKALKFLWISLGIGILNTLLGFSLFIDSIKDILKLKLIALSLFWTTGILNIVSVVASEIVNRIYNSTNSQEPKYLLFILAISFLFLAFLYYLIGIGKNWARITLLVLGIFGIPLSFMIFFLISIVFAIAPLFAITGIIILVLQIGAIIMLFKRESAVWFNSRK